MYDRQRLTRSENRALTRKRLCAAAVAEIAKRGVAGLSIEKITEQAGLTRGAFYYNYSSKYELLADIPVEASSAEVARWTDLIEEEGNVFSLLPLLAKRVDAFFEGQELLFVELTLEARRSPEFATFFRKSEHKVRAECAKLITALSKKASIRMDPTIAGLMLAIISSGLELYAPAPSQPSRGTILTEFIRTFLKAGTNNNKTNGEVV